MVNGYGDGLCCDHPVGNRGNQRARNSAQETSTVFYRVVLRPTRSQCAPSPFRFWYRSILGRPVATKSRSACCEKNEVPCRCIPSHLCDGMQDFER